MTEARDLPDVVRKNISVAMIRSDLQSLPHYDLPEGYRLRWYRRGDEDAWVRIHVAADRYNDVSRRLYRREFREDIPSLKKRQCFLIGADERPVGTATAWFDNDYHGAEFGQVHWVAIVPGEQGKGLSKPLLAAVCGRLRDLGHHRAYLKTSTARVPAINLYLRFGFVPHIRTPAHRDAWRDLRDHLKEDLRELVPA